MSLRGYKPKTRPAPRTFGKPIQARREIRIRRVSKIRQRTSAAYRTDARAFVKDLNDRGFRCPVVMAIKELRDGRRYGHPISSRINQVHHIYGRGYGGRGPLLMDKRLWLGCSTQGHRWIDANKERARAFGWLAPLGRYNEPVPTDTIVLRNQWQGVIIL